MELSTQVYQGPTKNLIRNSGNLLEGTKSPDDSTRVAPEDHALDHPPLLLTTGFDHLTNQIGVDHRRIAGRGDGEFRDFHVEPGEGCSDSLHEQSRRVSLDDR